MNKGTKNDHAYIARLVPGKIVPSVFEYERLNGGTSEIANQ